MKRTLIKLNMIVTMDRARRVIRGGGIVVNGNTIDLILTDAELSARSFEGDVVDAGSLVAIPGFIQTHIHLCQTLFRGLGDDLELLDWLKLRIFPYEAAHNAGSMHASAMVGVAELIRSGTTTIMDMGSIHHEEEVVRAIHETGLRAYIGKAMMDVNDLYPRLKEKTKDSISSTQSLAEQWHNSSGDRIRYAVAPRFVLSCSDALLREAYEMTRSFPGMLFHTHSSENKSELEAVRKRCGMDNVEFFESLNILHSNTCLAHCIWLNEKEERLLAERKSKVLHCPSSNLKLGSGIARIPQLRSKGITVSLGADGAPCNNNLDIFKEMRLAALVQKPLNGPTATDAKTIFEMATLGGAETLGISNEIGSIEVGKKADLVLLDLNRVWNSYDVTHDDMIYSSIVYSSTPENVRSVMVDGQWVFRNYLHLTLDEGVVVRKANDELRLLLGRVQ
ncbi:MAG: 5'-deoxyadenosine deaminase [Ignavibacteriae bacterium]|nr:5'-deoxyadenosine deaminase [Ignavibacteriota bacterium]